MKLNQKLNKINLSTPPEKILQMISVLREKKNNKTGTLKLINKAIDTTHDYIVNLYFERVHIFQLVYMTERDGLKKGDKKKLGQALRGMEKYLGETEKYIKQNGLKRWLHRLFRFWGKVSEYKENYKDAVSYYRRSLKYWKTDPEVVNKGLPRGLELKGFLASALIMSGETQKAMKLAKKVYKKYEETPEGKILKKKDYTTWAIWRVGVPIFVARGLVNKKVEFKRGEILSWLNDAEKLLNPPKTIKTWADFQFRKDEINTLRREIEKI